MRVFHSCCTIERYSRHLDCPPAVLYTTLQKHNISLFHLLTVIDSAAFHMETTRIHDTFFMQCRLRPQCVGVKHFTLFSFTSSYFLQCCTDNLFHTNRGTSFTSLCTFIIHFLFPQTVSHSGRQCLSMVKHEQETLHAATQTALDDDVSPQQHKNHN